MCSVPRLLNGSKAGGALVLLKNLFFKVNNPVYRPVYMTNNTKDN